MKLRIFLSAFVLVILPQLISAGFTIISNNGTSRSYYAPPIQFLGGLASFEPVTAPLIMKEVIDEHSATEDVSGKIVMVNEGRTFFEWAASAQAKGALALVLRNGYYDQLGYYEFRPPNYGFITIPVVAVSMQTWLELAPELRELGLNGSMDIAAPMSTVNITGGPTMMRRVITNPTFWVLSIANSLFACGTAAMLLVRFVKFYQIVGSPFAAISQFVLMFDFIGCVLRFVLWGADPMGQRVVFPHYVQLMMRTISVPFTLSATLLLTMYWFETVQSSSMSFSWSVDKLKVPAWTLTGAYLVIELVVDILYLTGYYNVVRWLCDYAVGGVYLVSGFLLGSFFAITSIRVMIHMFQAERRAATQASSSWSSPSSPASREKKKRERADRRSLQVAKRLAFSGLALLMVFICGLITVTPPFTRSYPAVLCYTWLALHASLTLKAFSTGLAMRLPKTVPTTKVNSIRSGEASYTASSKL